MKFKAGDKVRCISKSCAFGVEVGSIYTVKNPRLFESQVHEGVYCMELQEVGSTPYDKHFELVQEAAVLTPEEVFEHLRKGTQLQIKNRCITPRGVTYNWVGIGEDFMEDLLYETICSKTFRIKTEPEVIELNGKKYREITD